MNDRSEARMLQVKAAIDTVYTELTDERFTIREVMLMCSYLMHKSVRDLADPLAGLEDTITLLRDGVVTLLRLHKEGTLN
jgi:hypothetical protein